MRALIFDFDGLILDTETADFESWRVVYESCGVELPRDEWVAVIGTDGSSFDPVARLRELTGKPLDEQTLRPERRGVLDALVAELTPRPGVIDWMEEAVQLGARLAIASSSPAVWVERHLQAVSLRHHFLHLATLDQVRRAKPDPELYLHALSLLGVDAGDALALEDSPHGVTAARAAGIACVAVPGPMTQHCDFAHASMVLNSLADQSFGGVTRALARA